MLRPALSLLAASALAGVALTLPTAAVADTTGTVEVTGSAVRFDPTGRSGSAEVAYRCFDPEAGVADIELQTALLQGKSGRTVGFPEKDLLVTCDGSPHTTTITYSRKYVADDAPAVTNGKAQVSFYVGSGGPGDLSLPDQDVTVSGVAAPDTRADVKITLNAHPEPTRKGSRTTVEGKITRAGKAYAKKKVSLIFTPSGSETDTLIKTVKASKKGALETRVKASTTGTYRFVSDETTKTKPGASRGDTVPVVPALEKFARCTELNAVYPHGVGKKKAQDATSGDEVTDFAVDDAQYAKNKKSDLDHDGIACEKR